MIVKLLGYLDVPNRENEILETVLWEKKDVLNKTKKWKKYTFVGLCLKKKRAVPRRAPIRGMPHIVKERRISQINQETQVDSFFINAKGEVKNNKENERNYGFSRRASEIIITRSQSSSLSFGTLGMVYNTNPLFNKNSSCQKVYEGSSISTRNSSEKSTETEMERKG